MFPGAEAVFSSLVSVSGAPNSSSSPASSSPVFSSFQRHRLPPLPASSLLFQVIFYMPHSWHQLQHLRVNRDVRHYSAELFEFFVHGIPRSLKKKPLKCGLLRILSGLKGGLVLFCAFVFFALFFLVFSGESSTMCMPFCFWCPR